MTKNARTTEGRLAVFVSGVRIARCAGKLAAPDLCRPGVWARSLCINKSLQIGSLLPYIEMAVDHGFEVMVLNPNYNSIGGTFLFLSTLQVQIFRFLTTRHQRCIYHMFGIKSLNPRRRQRLPSSLITTEAWQAFHRS